MTQPSTAFEIERPVPAGDAVTDLLTCSARRPSRAPVRLHDKSSIFARCC